MNQRHTIVELPEQDELFDKIVSDPNHQITNISFSSAEVEGAVKHYALLVWHDYEYGDHNY